MKKSLVAVFMIASVGLSAAVQSAVAAEPVASEGKMLVTSNGARVGAVYRVTAGGDAQLILDGKLVTVPASSLSIVDGKLTTSLAKPDIRKLK